MRKDSCYMSILAGKVIEYDCAGKLRESSFLRAFALACILFALTLRAALPLGLSVVADDNGIPVIVCSQVAQIQARLGGETDPREMPDMPGYQCPFCMVLNADKAAIPVLDTPKPSFDPLFVAHIIRPAHLWIENPEPRKDDNLGRDPPLA